MTNTSLLSRIARRLPVVAGAALVPFAVVVPAHAVGPVICVGNPTGPCDDTAATIQAALIKAGANGTGATVLVGPGTYSDGPYYLDRLTLKGSGQGQTILTLPGNATGQSYVSADGSTVQDLTVKLAAAQSSNDIGLNVWQGSTVHDVTVDGAGTSNATALKGHDATVSSATFSMPLNTDARGVFAEGALTVTDSTITATTGFRHSNADTDRIARVRITATDEGISTDVGTVEADSVLIDLGASSGTGLAAVNYNANAAAKEIVAHHVSIVGGGASSQGAVAWAANPNAAQQSTIWLYDSIVEGPAKDMVVIAGNGLMGAKSTAKIVASYTSYSTWFATTQPGGVAQVLNGAGRLDVDPKFADPAAGDYRLTPGSPVVDKGDPEASGAVLDLAGKARVVDGDGNGTAVSDMGAYELPAPVAAPAPAATTPMTAPAPAAADATAPTTSFTKKPGRRVTTRKVRFGFTSDEAGVRFACKLDKGAWKACTSPTTLRVKLGKHRFQVRATDAAGNTDATPAAFRFTRVRAS